MLKHLSPTPFSPDRVIIVGAAGFVGKAVASRLHAAGVPVLGLAREDVDLLSAGAAAQLITLLRKSDTVVMISAQAPVKSNVMLIDNLRMMAAVCDSIAAVQVEHLIYVSSDAVYARCRHPYERGILRTAGESARGHASHTGSDARPSV